MQAVAQEQSSQDTQSYPVVVSVEFIAYLVLIAFMLLVGIANLDTVPMSDTESAQAMATYRIINADAPGISETPDSAILFWLQNASFTTLGVHESSSRILTVIGGILLALSPLFFREQLGVSRTFLLSLTLVFSPTVFAAARSSDTIIWTMLFAVLLLASLLRYWQGQQRASAYWTTVFLFALVFISGPGGLPLAIILLIAAAFTYVVTFSAQSDDDEAVEDVNSLRVSFWQIVRGFPWQAALLVAAGTTLALATGFMILPSGLNMVSAALGEALRGFVESAPGAPAAFPLLAILTYEPLLVIFAVIGITIRLRRGEFGVIDRFLSAWVIVAALFSWIYIGGTPGQSLWMTIPLAALASITFAELFVLYISSLFWLDDLFAGQDDSAYIQQIWWVKWVMGGIVLGLLMILTIHIEQVGRSLVTLPLTLPANELFALISDTGYTTLRYSLIWSVMNLLFLIVGFFLAASFWGNANVIQGYGVGLFVFMLLAGITSGWNTAVVNADNPVELWHPRATGYESFKLRETLFEVAARDTMGFPEIPITVVVGESLEPGVVDAFGNTPVLTETGVVAWLLRDFDNVQYVKFFDESRRDQIVLLPESMADPDLGGSYVGQSFLIRRAWDAGSMVPGDILGWWSQRHVRGSEPAQKVVLWLRQDVFDGSPVNSRP